MIPIAMIYFTVILIWNCRICEAALESKNIEINRAQPMTPAETGYIDWGTLRLTKLANRRDITVSGKLYVLQDLEEPEISWGYSLFRKAPMTKSFPTQPLMQYMNPICQAIVQDTIIYPDLVGTSNLPRPGECPIPKGTYTVNNFTISFETYRRFMPGEYKVMVIFNKNRKFLAGYEFLGTLT